MGVRTVMHVFLEQALVPPRPSAVGIQGDGLGCTQCVL